MQRRARYYLFRSLLYTFAAYSLLCISWKAPDYKCVIAYMHEYLDERGNAGLQGLLGKQTIEELAAHMSKTAQDTIDHYVRPLEELQLGGPYKYRQLDSALAPLHSGILNAIDRCERQIGDSSLGRKKRLLALQVLIGLNSAMALPLQGVGHLEPRDQFIKHDMFLNIHMANSKRSVLANRLYIPYAYGVRIAQAQGDQATIAAVMNIGYKDASRYIAYGINRAFALPGVIRLDGPDFGRIIEPGKDPIYTIAAIPRFPGNYATEKAFFSNRLQYPAEEWEKGIEGQCYVNLVVEKDGTVSRITVASGITPAIDSEIVRVMRLMPKWIPGSYEGKIVRSQGMQIFRFRIRPGVKREDAFANQAVEQQGYLLGN